MSFTRLIRIVELGLKRLMVHKLGSGLTMLGIVFGVFSVIAMLAIGEGASFQAQKEIVALGGTNIIVRSIKPVEGSSTDQNAGGSPRYGLTRTDFKRLTNTISTITNAIPVRELPREARYLKHTMNCRLVGCTADYLEVNHLRVTKGRFLSDADQDTRANVVVLAYEVANDLFPIAEPLGKAVPIGNNCSTVIGVAAQ